MKNFSKLVHAYMFKVSSANCLAFARISVCLCFLIFLTRNQFSNFPHSSFYQYWTPGSFFIFFKPKLSFEALTLLNMFLKIFLVLSILGLGTRIMIFISFLLGLFIHGYLTNFSNEIYHHSQMCVVALGILSIGSVNDSWSIDCLIKNKKLTLNRISEFYGFPLRLLLIWVVLVFFSSGYQKLINNSGISWVFSQNLRLRLHTAPELTTIGEFFLYSPDYIIYFLSFFAFITEVLSPLAMLKGWIFVIFSFLWIALHLFVYLSFGGHVSFFSQIGCYIGLLPFMLCNYDTKMAS